MRFPFDQTLDAHDLVLVALLVLLEGVLSVDNALVLGLLGRPLPARLRVKALSYGLIGALVFRVAAVSAAGFLLNWRLPKLLGAIYLLYVAATHLFGGGGDDDCDDQHGTSDVSDGAAISHRRSDPLHSGAR
jgi:predicted tellurium resistance membrane protein TerC